MGSRCRTWVVLADGMRLRILQATDEGAGFEEILHRNGRAASPSAGAALPRGTAGPAAVMRRPERPPPPGRRFETCVAHILNHGASLGLYDALVLVGPPPSLHRLTEGLNTPASGRLLVAVPADLLDLPDPVLLTRLQTLLDSRPGINRD